MSTSARRSVRTYPQYAQPCLVKLPGGLNGDDDILLSQWPTRRLELAGTSVLWELR